MHIFLILSFEIFQFTSQFSNLNIAYYDIKIFHLPEQLFLPCLVCALLLENTSQIHCLVRKTVKIESIQNINMRNKISRKHPSIFIIFINLKKFMFN